MRLHRSLFLVSAFFLFQSSIQQIILAKHRKNPGTKSAFQSLRPITMLILSALMILIEFRTAKFLQNFGFTENPYFKSLFVLLICGLLQDQTNNMPKSLSFTLTCMAATGLLMLCLSPCAKRTKGLN